MPLLSPTEVTKLKLEAIRAPQLRALCRELGIESRGTVALLIKRILNAEIPDSTIDRFIRQEYAQARVARQRDRISDDELRRELEKVRDFSWGVVQGQLDGKIQTRYVRVHVRYDELVNAVKASLHSEVTSYVICTWYNHWTTILLEDMVSSHPKVVPTLKAKKGIDIFFGGQPFDIKTTYIPRGYDLEQAISDPRGLAIWLYENQGAQRFGSDNRLYIVLADTSNLEDSWKLKREFPLLEERVSQFLSRETVGSSDEVVFTFGNEVYTALSKLLLITR